MACEIHHVAILAGLAGKKMPGAVRGGLNTRLLRRFSAINPASIYLPARSPIDLSGKRTFEKKSRPT